MRYTTESNAFNEFVHVIGSNAIIKSRYRPKEGDTVDHDGREYVILSVKNNSGRYECKLGGE